MYDTDISHVLDLLESSDWADNCLGVSLLDLYLLKHHVSFEEEVFDAAQPLQRILWRLQRAGALPDMQRVLASLLARTAALRGLADPRTMEVLAPLFKIMAQSRDLAGYVQTLLAQVGVCRNLLININFAFRRLPPARYDPWAVQWIVQHGRAEGVIALQEFLADSDFHLANQAFGWIYEMAVRLARAEAGSGLDPDSDFEFTSRSIDPGEPRPSPAAPGGARPREMIKFLHGLSGLVENIHCMAQPQRREEQVLFLQFNGSAHLEEIISLCADADQLNALLRSLAHGYWLASRRFDIMDHQLNSIIVHLADRAEERALKVQARAAAHAQQVDQRLITALKYLPYATPRRAPRGPLPDKAVDDARRGSVQPQRGASEPRPEIPLVPAALVPITA